MASTIWHFEQNQFDNSTKKSKLRMNILSANHHAKLEAENSDALINMLFTRFKPVQEVFADMYAEWFKAKGLYKGATKHFKTL